MERYEAATIEPPKTRRAQAKVERRQALIEATIDSIATYGLSGTTIARVTELAGTSVGLANFYFDSKERLFEAVLQHLADAEREVWQDCLAQTSTGPAEGLIALVEARFDARICNPRTLAVWFAFWGDAAAREIYRRMVEPTDDARLALLVSLIERLDPAPGTAARDANTTALGLEAFFDGLWLNLLLYPDAFPRGECHERAVEHMVALFPFQFWGLTAGALRPVGASCAKDLPHGP